MCLSCAATVSNWVYGHKCTIIFKIPVLMDVTMELGRKLSKALSCAISGKYRVPRCFIGRISVGCSVGAQVFLLYGVVLRNLKMKLFG